MESGSKGVCKRPRSPSSDRRSSGSSSRSRHRNRKRSHERSPCDSRSSCSQGSSESHKSHSNLKRVKHSSSGTPSNAPDERRDCPKTHSHKEASNYPHKQHSSARRNSPKYDGQYSARQDDTSLRDIRPSRSRERSSASKYDAHTDPEGDRQVPYQSERASYSKEGTPDRHRTRSHSKKYKRKHKKHRKYSDGEKHSLPDRRSSLVKNQSLAENESVDRTIEADTIAGSTLDTNVEQLLSEEAEFALSEIKPTICASVSAPKITTILTLLEAKLCLVDSEIQKIKVEKTPDDKLLALVDCVKHGSESLLSAFLSVLEDDRVKCGALAKKIRKKIEKYKRSGSWTAQETNTQSDFTATTHHRCCDTRSSNTDLECCKEFGWPIIDLVVMSCWKITPDTLRLLSDKKYKSLRALKQLSHEQLNATLTNPPFDIYQISYLVNMLSEHRDFVSMSLGDSIAMSAEHIQKLANNLKVLTSWLGLNRINKLITRLAAYDVVDQEAAEELENSKTNAEKVKCILLEILPSKQDSAFPIFLQALRDIDLTYVAHSLEMHPELSEEIDCYFEVKLNIRKTGADGKVHPKYLKLVRSLAALKNYLYENLSHKDSNRNTEIKKKLAVIETYQNKIASVCPGSVYIGVTSPDEESMLDLIYAYRSGKLKMVIQEALDIPALCQQFKIDDVEIAIDFVVLQQRFRQSWPIACLMSNLANVKSLTDEDVNMYEVDGQGRSALHWACAYSSLEIVKYLIDSGADVWARDFDGKTILMSACQDKDIHKILHLIDSGLDPLEEDNEGDTAVHVAAAFSSVEVVQFLVDKGCQLKPTDRRLLDQILLKEGKKIDLNLDTVDPLHLACAFNNLDVVKVLRSKMYPIDINEHLLIACLDSDLQKVKFLHEKGGSVKYNGAWYGPQQIAAEFSSLAVVEYLVEPGGRANQINDGPSPLMFACKDTNINKVKYFLDETTDINQADWNGSSALHFAAEYSSSHILEVLVGRGALVTAVDIWGRSVLHYASRSRYRSNLSYLLGLNKLWLLDVNKPDNEGQTPLHCCAQSGTISSMKLLIQAGADTNNVDINLRTALHHACQDSSLEKVQLCVKLGHDVNKPDKLGDTPLHLAAEHGTVEMMNYLVQAGADPNTAKRNMDTAMRVACKSKSVKKMKFCIENGMDVNEKDVEGLTPQMFYNKTPLSVSIRSKHYTKLIYLLLNPTIQISRDSLGNALTAMYRMDEKEFIFYLLLMLLSKYDETLDILNIWQDKERIIWKAFCCGLKEQGMCDEVPETCTERTLDLMYASDPLFLHNNSEEVALNLQKNTRVDRALIQTVRRKQYIVPSLYQQTIAFVRQRVPSHCNILKSYRQLKNAGLPNEVLTRIFLRAEMEESLSHRAHIMPLFFNVLDCDMRETHGVYDITRKDGQDAMNYKRKVLKLLHTVRTTPRLESIKQTLG